MQSGNFVGQVRCDYEKILTDVIDTCTIKEKFQSKQTINVIKYVKDRYGDELELLWEKYDECAVIRNKQNNKWYAVIMTIPESKLIEGAKRTVEIIDLKYEKDKSSSIIDGKIIFPGYHMNKKSWITIILDESVENKKIQGLIDHSYDLSIG